MTLSFNKLIIAGTVISVSAFALAFAKMGNAGPRPSVVSHSKASVKASPVERSDALEGYRERVATTSEEFSELIDQFCTNEEQRLLLHSRKSFFARLKVVEADFNFDYAKGDAVSIPADFDAALPTFSQTPCVIEMVVPSNSKIRRKVIPALIKDREDMQALIRPHQGGADFQVANKFSKYSLNYFHILGSDSMFVCEPIHPMPEWILGACSCAGCGNTRH